MTDPSSAIAEALREVHDPCCRERGISVVDMGLVRSIDVDPDRRRARVELLLTTGWCPFASTVLDSVEDAALAVDGIDSAEVEVVWDEAWTMERLSPEARAKLVFLPEPSEVASRDEYVALKGRNAR